MRKQYRQVVDIVSSVGTPITTSAFMLSSASKDDSRTEPLLTVERLRALATIVRRIKERIRVPDGDGPQRDVDCEAAACTTGGEDPAEPQERRVTR